MLRPTSKASLKSQCLFASNGNMEQADKLYEYFTKDMPDLPLYDAPDPTWADNTKATLNSILSFFGDHKDGIAQGYEVVRSILNARGASLPSLGAGAGEAVAEAVSDTTLPPINE